LLIQIHLLLEAFVWRKFLDFLCSSKLCLNCFTTMFTKYRAAVADNIYPVTKHSSTSVSSVFPWQNGGHIYFETKTLSLFQNSILLRQWSQVKFDSKDSTYIFRNENVFGQVMVVLLNPVCVLLSGMLYVFMTNVLQF